MVDEELRDGRACLAEDVVFQFASAQLSATDLGVVEAHLARCGDCRKLVAAVAQDGAEEPDAADTTIADGGPASFDASDDAARLPQPGEAVGRYRVTGAIGMGGMGVVFLAVDPTLNRRVTLKLLRADRQAHGAAHGMLLHEAQSMAKLAHPNVVSVYDAGSFGNQVFMAMEFVEGSTLGAWLAAEARSWRDVLAVFLDAGRGLATAHAGGILHRDFKPSNVLVGKDGRARVTDFGLARVMGPTGGDDRTPPELDAELAPVGALGTSTRTGTVKGTPGYMAPEQLAGKRLDARADQFSFCVALYEGFYGHSPFEGEDVTERAAAAVEGRIRPPPADDPLPRGLRACVLKGAHADPDARHASMSELLLALERYASLSSSGPIPRWIGKRRMLVVAFACAAASALAMGTMHRSRAGAVPPSEAARADAPLLPSTTSTATSASATWASTSSAPPTPDVPASAPVVVAAPPASEPQRRTNRRPPARTTTTSVASARNAHLPELLEPSFARKK